MMVYRFGYCPLPASIAEIGAPGSARNGAPPAAMAGGAEREEVEAVSFSDEEDEGPGQSPDQVWVTVVTPSRVVDSERGIGFGADLTSGLVQLGIIGSHEEGWPLGVNFVIDEMKPPRPAAWFIVEEQQARKLHAALGRWIEELPKGGESE